MKKILPAAILGMSLSLALQASDDAPGRKVNGDSVLVEIDGVKLLIDPMSIQYLAGAEIDYKEDLEGARFVIRNPNAATTCGCGSSFSV